MVYPHEPDCPDGERGSHVLRSKVLALQIGNLSLIDGLDRLNQCVSIECAAVFSCVRRKSRSRPFIHIGSEEVNLSSMHDMRQGGK